MTDKCTGICILPWIHASVGTTGDVFPCCRVICFEPDKFGDLKNEKLESVRQNQNFSEFRKMMLEGQSPLICKNCYLEESSGLSSLRTQFNNKYPELLKQVLHEKRSQALALKYAEVRFSNQCNLACRTCHLEFSTSWHKDHEALYGKSQKLIVSSPGLLSEIEESLDSIEMIYIAGGEPLIQKQHYQLLDLLIRRKRTDIKLIYDTNLTALNFGSTSVLNLWKHFQNIHVNGSVDGVKERFNLIRHGEDWEKVENNIRKIRLMLPHVELVLAPTISVLNVFHLPDMIRYCLEKKLIPNISYLRFNFLYEPFHYQVNSLPEKFHPLVLEKLELIESKDSYFLSQIDFLKAAFKQPLKDNQLHLFRDFTLKLDSLRGEKTSQVCPELSELLG